MHSAKIAAILTTALLASSALAQQSDNSLPTDELVKQWWQLTLSIPNSVRADFRGWEAGCGLGQRGVWFLTSEVSAGRPITQNCLIPQGRKLFVPVVTAVCTPFPGETLEENIQICREAVDPYDKLVLTIDGKNRNDLIERRAQSRGFPAWFPENNIFDTPGQFDVPAGIYIMVAEGQFALVEGLAVGAHVIRATASSSTDASVPKFDVIFRIRMAPATSVTPR
ncbi:MAG TPA: hypothetical protein VH814_10895 [Steroidobacteraceae bacterium]|jgi:hypothetical protein